MACIKGQLIIVAEANDASACILHFHCNVNVATVPVIFTTSIESDGTIWYVGIHGKIHAVPDTHPC